MKAIRLILVLTLSVGALASSVLANPAKPRGTILFADENGYLWTAKPNMTNVTEVGGGVVNGSEFRPGVAGSFSLSPDAKTIVFGACTCASGLAVVNTDGTGFSEIPGTSDVDTQPRWSPQGTKLAFIVYDPSTSRDDVATMNPDGSDVVNLTADYLIGGQPVVAEDPEWSPDGSRIVFWGGYNGYHLYSVNADGTGFKQLTSGNFQDTAPRWSPNGKLIAFSRWDYDPNGTAHGVYVMRPNGTHLRQITTATQQPSWSPTNDLAYTTGNGLEILDKLDPVTAVFYPGPYFANYDWVAGTLPPA
jgi:Tol biopolymer transport system component